MKSYLKTGIASMTIYIILSIIAFVLIKVLVIPELTYTMEKSPLTAIFYAGAMVLLVLKVLFVIAVKFTSGLLEDYSFPFVRCIFPVFLDYELGYIYSEALEVDYFAGFKEYIDPESSFQEKVIDLGTAFIDLIVLSAGYIPMILGIVMWLFAIVATIVLKIKVGFYSMWPAHQICLIIFFALFMMNMIARSYVNSRILRESEMPSVSAFWATFPIIVPIGSGLLYFIVGSVFSIGASSLYNFLLLSSIVVIPISMLIYSKSIFNDKIYEDRDNIRNFDI